MYDVMGRAQRKPVTSPVTTLTPTRHVPFTNFFRHTYGVVRTGGYTW